jgi:hypothetical protein
MADDNIERIPIKDIRQEEGAHELASSPNMKPYLEFIKAVMQDHDPSPETGSDSPVAAREAICLEGCVGPEMGPCRLRKP